MEFRKVTLEVLVQNQDSDLVKQALGYALERIEERVTVIWSDLGAQSAPRFTDSEKAATPLN